MAVAHRLDHIAPFHVMAILEKAKALEVAGHDVIHMEIGEPDFPTPAPIVAAGMAALQNGRTFYTPALGIPELRQAIARFYQQRYGVDVPARRIVVTPGASGALQLALAALVNPGEQVLLPDPTYPCNRHLVSLVNGEPVSIPVNADSGYQLQAEDIARHWSANTVAAMIASPANPTGTLIAPDALQQLHQAVRAQGGVLLVDELYHGLTYDGDAHTALAVSDDIFVVNSFSKYFQMTGWRLGWLVVPDAYVDAVTRLAQNLFLSPSTPAQYAALAAFTPETQRILESRRAEFQRRRDALLAAFAPLGFKFPAQPQGAFYVYADVSAHTDDSFAWAEQILQDAHVAIAPGRDFGQHQAARHVRLAYTTSEARLREAAARIAACL